MRECNASWNLKRKPDKEFLDFGNSRIRHETCSNTTFSDVKKLLYRLSCITVMEHYRNVDERAKIQAQELFYRSITYCLSSSRGYEW